MRDLEFTLKELIKHNKEGSYSTHAYRRERLMTAIGTLQDKLGFKPRDINNLKGKHVRALVKHWLSEDLKPGTIKNRMTDLRWLASKIGNPRIVERTNSAYGIERRKYVDNSSNIAKTLDNSSLRYVTNEFIVLSLKLQEAFGLRREESLKIQVDKADRGNVLVLDGSWCKGGRSREIPILTAYQQELLADVRDFCLTQGTSSLIPADKSYYQQMRSYEYQTRKSGLNRNHGLRHHYAQQRYHQLTGRLSPKCGGPTIKQMTTDQRTDDYSARMIISSELGHSREQITANYLGR